MKSKSCYLLLLSCGLVLSGCAKSGQIYPTVFNEHRSPLVRNFAELGEVATALPVGVPLMVVGGVADTMAYPVTGKFGKSWYHGMELSASAGSAIVGAPMWVLFGWWWPGAKAPTAAPGGAGLPPEQKTPPSKKEKPVIP